jgi:hypothetical protein
MNAITAVDEKSTKKDETAESCDRIGLPRLLRAFSKDLPGFDGWPLTMGRSLPLVAE